MPSEIAQRIWHDADRNIVLEYAPAYAGGYTPYARIPNPIDPDDAVVVSHREWAANIKTIATLRTQLAGLVEAVLLINDDPDAPISRLIGIQGAKQIARTLAAETETNDER